jgi:hypothetical protein
MAVALGYTQGNADSIYTRVLAAGFSHSIAAGGDPGAVDATAVIIAHPSIDPGLLWRQYSPTRDPHAMTGWDAAWDDHATDRHPELLLATLAALRHDVAHNGPTGALAPAGDVATGLASGVDQGLQAIPAVTDAFMSGLAAVFKIPAIDVPGFVLRIVYVVAGAALVVVALGKLALPQVAALKKGLPV